MVNDILLQIHLIYLSVFLRPTISVHLFNQFVLETKSVKSIVLQPAEFGGISNISVFIFRKEYK